MGDANSIVVKGKRIDRALLEPRDSQRCVIAECQAWCCTGGVWVDLWERDKILEQAEKIKPFLPESRHDTAHWFDGEREQHPDYPSGWGEGTAVIDDPSHPAGTTCIFLRPEDRFCALQYASLAHGEHPWSLKPFYCVLHPLTMEDGYIELDDSNIIYVEGGNCQRPADTKTPLSETFRGELEFVLGEDGLETLLEVASRKED